MTYGYRRVASAHTLLEAKVDWLHQWGQRLGAYFPNDDVDVQKGRDTVRVRIAERYGGWVVTIEAHGRGEPAGTIVVGPNEGPGDIGTIDLDTLLTREHKLTFKVDDAQPMDHVVSEVFRKISMVVRVNR